jgi:hypothetical protein
MFSVSTNARRLAALVASSVAAAAAVACGGGGSGRVTAESVFKKCNPPASSYITLKLSSDKKAIDYDFYAGTETAETVYNCLLKESGAPSSVDYRVKETRPIDGTQTAKWNGWEMYWNYSGKSKGCTIHLSEA